MDAYVKQLEAQNEELKQKLAKYETVADLRKQVGNWGKIGGALLVQTDCKVTDNGSPVSTINVGTQSFQIVGTPDIQVDLHMVFKCDVKADVPRLQEFIRELCTAFGET